MGEITMEDIGSILDRVIKEEFGGCDPRKDNPCKIQARVSDGLIYVFAVGKWRAVSRAGRKYPPLPRWQAEARKTLRINTGSKVNRKGEFKHIGGSGAVGTGVFDGKEIELVFLPTKEENDANLVWNISKGGI